MKSYGERWAKVPNSVKMLIKWWKWWTSGQTWYNVMNIVTLWLKVIKSVQQWQKKNYQPIMWSTPIVASAHSAPRLWDCHSFYDFHVIFMAFQWNSMASRWNAVECHGIPWDTEDCHSLYGFHTISVELYGIQVECCGKPWNSMGYRRYNNFNSGNPWNLGMIYM